MWMHKRESEACPGCGHAMIVLVDDPDSVRQQNEIRKKDYELSIKIWESEGAVPKKKPKMPKGNVEQMLVCMCCVSQCLDLFSGKGCIVCEEFC